MKNPACTALSPSGFPEGPWDCVTSCSVNHRPGLGKLSPSGPVQGFFCLVAIGLLDAKRPCCVSVGLLSALGRPGTGMGTHPYGPSCSRDVAWRAVVFRVENQGHCGSTIWRQTLLPMARSLIFSWLEGSSLFSAE